MSDMTKDQYISSLEALCSETQSEYLEAKNDYQSEHEVANSLRMVCQRNEELLKELSAIRAENAELKQKLAAAEESKWPHANFVKRVLEAGSSATEQDRADAYRMVLEFRNSFHTIESLNLRVARLSEIVQDMINAHSEVYSASPEGRRYLEKMNSALSSESDGQWLREKQAEDAIEIQEEKMIGPDELDGDIELRSPESDIDRAMRER